MKTKIDAPLRQEIQTVLIHQETLMQQYRSSLYTIQSLLFGTFAAAFAGLWAAQLGRGAATYCLSGLQKLPLFEALWFVVFCILVVVAVIGPLLLSAVMNVIVRRGELVTLCQRLLMLDDLGMLEDVWSQCVRQADGTRAGIQLVLQVLEGRRLVSPQTAGFFTDAQFDPLRSRLRDAELSPTRRSGRELFNQKIPLYFRALWFAAWIALFFYVFGILKCSAV